MKLSYSDIRTLALSYLARREYSRAELMQKLQQRLHKKNLDESFDANELLGSVLDDLTESGWLSNQRAAEQMVMQQGHRYGTQRIEHNLRQKGLDETQIQDLMPELRENEFSVAYRVWQKKFACVPENNKEKAQQIRFLQYRGFSMSIIMKLVNADRDWLEEVGYDE